MPILNMATIQDLIEQKFVIQGCIADELAKYDLLEYGQEYGVWQEITFAEYPADLKDYLLTAWAEIENIDRQLKLIINE